MLDAAHIGFLRKSADFFPGLSEEKQAELVRHTAVVSYRKGQNIHSAENECIGVLLVTRGELRTYILSEDGREVTLYRLFPGEVCILSASCLLRSITFDVFIDAEQDSEALLIGAPYFARLMEENIYVENFALRMAADRFSDVIWAMEQILFMSFDRRLATFLLDESVQKGSDDVSLTHEQIARYMGSAREVVSRMLKYLVQEGAVAARRGGVVILDKVKLKRIAGIATGTPKKAEA